ncbi:MAG: ribokinase [Stappiaceae bacterium]
MIVVYGSINVDLVVAVEHLPTAGETVIGADHQTFAGGKGSNQALAARRAGGDVCMVGPVGGASFAGTALENLKSAGADVSGVRAASGSTGLALIGVAADGENQIIVASGANRQTDPVWLNGLIDKDTTLVLQLELPIDHVVGAIAQATEAGAKTVLNIAPFDVRIAPHLSEIDVLIANEVEVAELAGTLKLPAEPEQFTKLYATHHNRTCVVTLGGEGCIAHDGSTFYKVAAPEIEVVDTTGAGDAFVGSLSASLDRGNDLSAALADGTAAGALACTRTGAQTSAPDSAEIAAMAKEIFVRIN